MVIESISRFDRVFSTLLTHEYAASAPSKDQEEQEEQDSRLTDLVTSSNTAANSCIAPVPSQDTMDLSPKSLATSSQSQQHQQQPRGKFNSNSIVHLYHMIVAIDGVYEFLMTDFEVWRNAMKTWLLRLAPRWVCRRVSLLLTCSIKTFPTRPTIPEQF